MKAIVKKLNRSKGVFAAMMLPLLFCGFSVLAGNGSLRQRITVCISPGADWVLDKTVANVDFYHSITVCNGKNVVLLKLINRNAGPVKIGWREAFVTRERLRVEGYGGRKEMILQPGTTMPADCADLGNKKIRIAGGDVDPMAVIDIVNFNYVDITVALQ